MLFSTLDLMLHFRYNELGDLVSYIQDRFVNLTLGVEQTDRPTLELVDYVSLRPISKAIINDLTGLGLGPDKKTKPGNGPKDGKGPENGNGSGGGHWFFGEVDNGGANPGANGNNGNGDPGGNGNGKAKGKK